MNKKKKSKKPNTSPASPRSEEREEDEALREFSDGYDDFYADESGSEDGGGRRRGRPSEDREIRRTRKPKSPLKRRLRRVASTVAILGVIIVIGVILSLTVLFKTQTYKVIGNSLYLESDIISTCGIAEGENIFLAPKKPAEERIVKRFPYIESVKVSFSIPDTIKIDIKEAAEGYLFKVSETEYLIISTKGRILNRIADKTGYDLPIFIGPKLSSGEIGDFVAYEDVSVLEMIDSITQVFADNGYQGVTEINATDPAAITFTYDSRIMVKLGLPEDLSYKIRTAMTIIDTKIDVNSTSSVTGVLDVSRCNTTKRSYFNEQSIGPTTPEPTGPTEASSDDSYDWSDDSYDWSDDSYDWYDDSYYGDDGYYYGDYE